MRLVEAVEGERTEKLEEASREFSILSVQLLFQEDE